jgi:hypothetical protein
LPKFYKFLTNFNFAMPQRHYPPAYLRYLKARLWNLARPSFWGTAIVLSVVGLIIKEYWTNPGFLVNSQTKPVASPQQRVDSSLSAEDKAIAADIDNLPVLYNDAEQAELPPTANTPKDQAQPKSKGLLDDLLNKRQPAASDSKLNLGLDTVNLAPAPKITNPFLTQADNLLQVGTFQTNTQTSTNSNNNSLSGSSFQPGVTATSPSLGTQFNNQPDRNINGLTINPLQAALNQSRNQKQSSLNDATSNQTSQTNQTNTLRLTPDGGTTLTQPSNGLPSQTLSPNTFVNRNPTNNTIAPGYTGTPYTQPQNSYSNFSGTQTSGTPYNQPITNQPITNQPQSSYGNFNSNQGFPTTAPPSTTVTPITPAPTNAPLVQTPLNQGAVTPTNPTVYGNSAVPQAQTPQSNVSNLRPKPGAYGGVEINGYTFP